MVLKQVPIAFNAGMKPLQQLYFTLIALERPDLHAKVFTAIHGEHKRLIDKKAMGEWAAAQGVDRAKFDSVFDSFSVQTQVQRANQLADAYRIEGTPSFAVGGKFMTSPVMAGNSYEGALKEVTRLIPMARGNWAPGCARRGAGKKMPRESRGIFHGRRSHAPDFRPVLFRLIQRLRQIRDHVLGRFQADVQPHQRVLALAPITVLGQVLGETSCTRLS